MNREIQYQAIGIRARVLTAMLLGCMCWAIADSMRASNEHPGRPSALSSVPAYETIHELAAADVQTFLDIAVPEQLRRENIAGATIAVVKDGQILFAKGYGYSDVAKKKPVSAARRCFGQARCRSYSPGRR